jgi:hypothetical protein
MEAKRKPPSLKKKRSRKRPRKNPGMSVKALFPIVSTPNHLLWKIKCPATYPLENSNHSKNLVTANTVITYLVLSCNGKKNWNRLSISCIQR